MAHGMTTWGDLRNWDVILDKSGNEWSVGEPERYESEVRVRIVSTKNPAKSVVMVEPLDKEVERVRTTNKGGFAVRSNEDMTTKPVDGEATVAEQVEKVQETFGKDKVELLATETTDEQQAREAATADNPLELPAIDDALNLRGHLYLMHALYIGDATNELALREHHKKAHERETEGQGEPGYAHHNHEGMRVET